MITQDMISLQKEFERIRKMGPVKCLRRGPTGIGYTFETLLNKKEDQESKPDYKSIEIICKHGFGEDPLSLFHCSPMKDGKYATRYVFEKYGYYPHNDSTKEKIYYNKLFCNFSVEHGGYDFKLKVDRDKRYIVMLAYKNNKLMEEVCYWHFDILEKKLTEKLSNLAIVYGYPYYLNGEKYYKYLRMYLYTLKSFDKFLELIEDDKIFIQMYIKDGVTNIGTPRLSASDVSFRMRLESVTKLFNKVK